MYFWWKYMNNFLELLSLNVHFFAQDYYCIFSVSMALLCETGGQALLGSLCFGNLDFFVKWLQSLPGRCIFDYRATDFSNKSSTLAKSFRHAQHSVSVFFVVCASLRQNTLHKFFFRRHSDTDKKFCEKGPISQHPWYRWSYFCWLKSRSHWATFFSEKTSENLCFPLLKCENLNFFTNSQRL